MGTIFVLLLVFWGQSSQTFAQDSAIEKCIRELSALARNPEKSHVGVVEGGGLFKGSPVVLPTREIITPEVGASIVAQAKTYFHEEGREKLQINNPDKDDEQLMRFSLAHEQYIASLLVASYGQSRHIHSFHYRLDSTLQGAYHRHIDESPRAIHWAPSRVNSTLGIPYGTEWAKGIVEGGNTLLFDYWEPHKSPENQETRFFLFHEHDIKSKDRTDKRGKNSAREGT